MAEDEFAAKFPELANARVRVWFCPVDEHGKRNAVTVEWIGDTARCTAPGCTITSDSCKEMAVELEKAEQRAGSMTSVRSWRFMAMARAALAVTFGSAAPNQTAAEPPIWYGPDLVAEAGLEHVDEGTRKKVFEAFDAAGQVADSELRDRIAEKLASYVGAPSTGAFGSDAEYATWALNGVMAVVAPVLAERDAQIAELKAVLNEECERLTAAWAAARDANMTALETIATLQAEIDRLRRNADRDARIVDGLRGERITLWEERDKAATALSAIKDWKWERPPTLLERIELVASELDIARRQRDAYKDLLGELQLYVAWRYVTKQLTTEQKEMWADAVQAWNPDPSEPVPEPSVDRWWRDDSKETPVGLHSVGEIESQRVVGVGSQPDSLDERTIERITYTNHDGVEKVWDDQACSWVVDQPGGET